MAFIVRNFARAFPLALLISALLFQPLRFSAFLLPPTALAQTIPTPDPTLLPVATLLQSPLVGAYGALNVPGLPAGGSYQDPTTNVKIYKLTSATFPTTGYSWTHSYSEGGDEVSLPHTGTTRTIHLYTNAGWHWLIDFTPGVGVSNPRMLDGVLKPWMDLAFAFSNNPATPYYAYTATTGGIRRFDVRTMTEVPGNGWPLLNETNASWFHQSANDAFFVWMRGVRSTPVVGYEPATGTLKTFAGTGYNMIQPRVDRAGRYVGITLDAPNVNGAIFWDWQTNSVVWVHPGDPAAPFAHIASLKRRWLGVQWNEGPYPPPFYRIYPDVPSSAVDLGTGATYPADATTVHGSGNWIQNPANLGDQWAVFLHYGSLVPTGTWLAPGGMVLITENGQRRLLAHSYNTSANYTFYSFAKFSPDGNYVLFTSDMNGSPRSDVFLAELPTSGAPPAPSINTLTPSSIGVGAAGFILTVTGSNFTPTSVVQWNGTSRATTFSSSAQLQATILANDVVNAGTAQVTVLTPAPGGGLSGALPFTMSPNFLASVVRAGTGSGTVTSTPAGISCGTSCAASFLSGTTVTLTATPAVNSVIGVWSGCDTVAGSQCTVTVSSARTVTATFQAQPATPPSVSMTSPTAGTQVAGAIPISASASSSVGIAGVQFQLDGVNLGAELTTFPYTMTWNTAAVANGSHTLAAVARDTTSTRTTSLSIGVTVGNPPIISSVAVSSITSSSGSVVWTTNMPSTSQIEYGLTTSYGNTTPFDTTLVTAHAVTLTNLASGTFYHYRVRSQDAAGIMSISGDFTLTTSVPSTTTPPTSTTTPAAIGPSTQPVVWANLVNVVATGGSLQKTTGCDGCFDAGAITQQQISSGNGYIEFTATEAGALRYAGLAHAFTPTNEGTIDFAFRFQSGIAEVRELGVYRTDVPFITGDVFRISVVSGTVRYYKNGGLVYTSTVPATYPLVGASALASLYATVTNATMGSASPQVVWANLVNVVATGGSLQKTSGCDGCFDAGAITQQQISSGNGYIEFTATETGALRYAGLAHAFTPTNQGTIDFAFRFQSGIAEVREMGAYRANVSFITGDVFRISVASGTVRYYKNGGLVYTSAVPATYPLVGASTLASLYATVTNATISGTSAIAPIPLAPVAWSIVAPPAAPKGNFLETAVAAWTTTTPLMSQQPVAPVTTLRDRPAKSTRHGRGQTVTAAAVVSLLKVRLS